MGPWITDIYIVSSRMRLTIKSIENEKQEAILNIREERIIV